MYMDINIPLIFILSLMQTGGGQMLCPGCIGDVTYISHFTIHSILPFKPILCHINYQLTLVCFENT